MTSWELGIIMTYSVIGKFKVSVSHVNEEWEISRAGKLVFPRIQVISKAEKNVING